MIFLLDFICSVVIVVLLVLAGVTWNEGGYYPWVLLFAGTFILNFSYKLRDAKGV